MRFSHSKLNTILTCPMTYHYSYELGIKPKERKVCFEIGDIVHQGIEKGTTDVVNDYYGDDITKERVIAEELIKLYLNRKNELFKEIVGDKPFKESHELELECHILNFDFMGIIDLLIEQDDGFIIIDYKTSSSIPAWDKYLEQLYRYCILARFNFKKPIKKIGIINLRKTTIKPRAKETNEDFFKRIKIEYRTNPDNYIDYKIFDKAEIEDSKIDYYLNNLTQMMEQASFLIQSKAWYINYSNLDGMYGKSDYYDIFKQNEDAYLLYTIRDFVWDEEEQTFVFKRDCNKLDVDINIDEDKKVFNYKKFLKQSGIIFDNATYNDVVEDLKAKGFIFDEQLIKLYYDTYHKIEDEFAVISKI